jgi:S1-C subfamily serine protease
VGVLFGQVSHADTPPAVEVRSEQSTVRVVVYFYDGAGKLMGRSRGTGTIVGSGQVVTNRHVLHHPGAQSIDLYVVPDRRSGTQRLDGHIADESVDFDLALITVKDLKAPAITLASETDIKGAGVRALGYPAKVDDLLDSTDEALGTPTEPYLTEGNVALLTTNAVISGARIPVVFHTAAINSGNSGGPLVDDCGRLVGVNTSIAATTINENGIDSANGEFIASGTENLVVFLKRNKVTPIVDPRHCDHGRVVAAFPQAPPTSAPPRSMPEALSAALADTGAFGRALVRLVGAYVIQISGTILAFALIYLLFLRNRITPPPPQSCPVPVTCDAPETPV